MKKLTKLLLVALMVFGGFANFSINVKARDHIELFVERMYQEAFNRNPDTTGMDYWTTRLRNKTVSASEFVSGVLLSTEMYNRNLSEADFVEICYKAITTRNSDPNGKAYWIKQAQNHKRSYIVKGFIDSQEFAKLCTLFNVVKGTMKADTNVYGTNIPNNRTVFNCTSKLEEFFKRNYQKVLGRTADANGLKYWVNEVSSGRQSAGIAASSGFLHSKEFLGLDTNGNYKGGYKSNEEFIKTLYRAYLGREAEGSGFNYWFERLKSGTLTRDRIIMGFATSNEFANIIKSYQEDTSCGITKPTPTQFVEPTGGNADDFLNYIYTNLIGRQPTTSERTYDFDTINRRKQANSVVANIINNSKEFKNRYLSDGEYIDLLFKTLRGRTPTAEEKYQYASRMLSQYRDFYFFREMVNSVEFQNICSKYSVPRGDILPLEVDTFLLYYGSSEDEYLYNSKRDTYTEKNNFSNDTEVNEFINRCYKFALNRTPSNVEIANWTNKLKDGTTNKRKMIVDILHSKEFITRYTTNGEYVNIIRALCTGIEGYLVAPDNFVSGFIKGDKQKYPNYKTRDAYLDEWLELFFYSYNKK